MQRKEREDNRATAKKKGEQSAAHIPQKLTGVNLPVDTWMSRT